MELFVFGGPWTRASESQVSAATVVIPNFCSMDLDVNAMLEGAGPGVGTLAPDILDLPFVDV